MRGAVNQNLILILNFFLYSLPSPPSISPNTFQINSKVYFPEKKKKKFNEIALVLFPSVELRFGCILSFVAPEYSSGFFFCPGPIQLYFSTIFFYFSSAKGFVLGK